jgi:hypothetical protein
LLLNFSKVIEGVQNYARGCQPEAEPLVKATGYSQKGCLDTKTESVRKYRLLIFIHVLEFYSLNWECCLIVVGIVETPLKGKAV